MLMLIAPSKTQEMKGPQLANVTQPELLKDSEQLIFELAQFSVVELAELMKMSERLAVLTHRRIKDFQIPFTPENSCPALTVFQGDVYSAIDMESYGKEEVSYLQEHLRILSGLYGLLRPLDLIQPYRLEMGCRLPNKRGGNLYRFWEERVTEELNHLLTSHQEPILVNLASAEYSRVIKKKNLQGRLLQIDFKERKGDSYRTVAIHAKRARGMMVDFAAKRRITEVEGLKGFQESGYRFQETLSTAEHYLFTRDDG